MDTGRISGRYAKAVYAFAAETGEETRLYEEMKTLAESCSEFRDLKKVLESPAVSSQDKVKVLTTAAGVNVSKSYLSLLKLLVTNRRESYAHSIALMYGEYYRKQKGMLISQLTTAEEASEDTKQKLKEIIAKGANIKVDFETEIDTSIIGGFVLRLGDQQLDASIKTQLRRLENQLLESNNIK